MLPTGGGEIHVTLIDMPSFNDTIGNDAETLNLIAAELAETYRQNRKLSGIIYFHCISDNHMEGSAAKQLRMFREMCGDDSGVLKNVIFATNHWDRLESEEVGIARLTELENNPCFWKTMCAEGSRVARFQATTESALELIRFVIPNTPLPLRIQREMVGENKLLEETSVGRIEKGETGKHQKEHGQALRKKEFEHPQKIVVVRRGHGGDEDVGEQRRPAESARYAKAGDPVGPQATEGEESGSECKMGGTADDGDWVL